MIRNLLVLAFVDSRLLHYWPCHRLQARSFSVDGRQFHVCARCTGLIVGMLVAPFLLQFAGILFPLALPSVVLFFVDGVTQLIRLRESSNALRFATGAFVSIAVVAWVFHYIMEL